MGGADPEGSARPPLFAPNSLKCQLIWPKYAKIILGVPPCPLLFQILDPPLNNLAIWLFSF